MPEETWRLCDPIKIASGRAATMTEVVAEPEDVEEATSAAAAAAAGGQAAMATE